MADNGNNTAAAMAEYELPPASAVGPAPERSPALSTPLLVKNAEWFCRLRWIVVAILFVFGLLVRLPGIALFFSVPPASRWPWVCAAVLGLGNILFAWHARRVAREGRRRLVAANLWAQILLDLVILTLVVQFLGGARSVFAFAYLFHIVLACIFLPRGQSLLVTLLACLLYLAGTSAAQAGAFGGGFMAPAIWPIGLTVGVTQGIWLVVWYLTSQITAMVRARDLELSRTNEQLLRAQEERTRHMLATTHQLKAPFAAIQANTQLLLDGYCGELPGEAREIAGRISARCRRLTREIQEMLQLANLRSEGQRPPSPQDVDLQEAWCYVIRQLEPLASERGVRIETLFAPAAVRGIADHLKMLFNNLLSNAIVYSRREGRVRVQADPRPGGGARVVVEDHGIGIAPEKLPRIFDEYYRTEEAAQFNKESSGLGLAIVRHVAHEHGVRLKVASWPGRGTTFTLDFPPVGHSHKIVRSTG